MYNQHQHLKAQEDSKKFKDSIRKLKKVHTERGSLIRVDSFISKVKSIEDDKTLAEMLSGNYMSGNPARHKYRDYDELLPKAIKTYE